MCDFFLAKYITPAEPEGKFEAIITCGIMKIFE